MLGLQFGSVTMATNCKHMNMEIGNTRNWRVNAGGHDIDDTSVWA